MDAKKFKVKKHVIKPLMKLKTGVEYYIQVKGPLFIGKKIGDKEPATLCDVVDLSTGELAQIIVAKVMRESMQEQYPNESYVGKCFAFELVREQDADGKAKRYNTLRTFVEIEPTEAPKAAVKAA